MNSKIISCNIIVPMAGRGSRFANAGYGAPKPLIDVAGRPMISWVIENLKLKSSHRFIFICQREHYDKYDLRKVFSDHLGSNWDVVLLDGVTDGAACTVLKASHLIDNCHPIIIANSDQYIDADINEFYSDALSSGLSGLIMTFQDDDPKWSYARVAERGLVDLVVEKEPISNNATVGLYYFRHGQEFVKSAHKMILENFRVSGEFYVAPCYNYAISAGAKVAIWEIDKSAMHGLGTPEDLMNFLKTKQSS